MPLSPSATVLGAVPRAHYTFLPDEHRSLPFWLGHENLSFAVNAPAPAFATRLQLARAITAVENERPGADALWQAARKHCGRAQIIGITGAPGAGKSTLVAALLREYLARGKRVAVLAVDPSSPVTGGALLGDRVRMGEFETESVFIRSVSARGHLGGLSRSAGRIIDVFDAAGFDLVLVETVGTGQSEVEIARYADVRLVICPPGLGDEVQAIKAGVLEIADLLVVNKADLPAAERTLLDLRVNFAGRRQGAWEVKVLATVATRGEGIAALADALDAHAAGVGRGLRLKGTVAAPKACGVQQAALVVVGATCLARRLAPMAALAGYAVTLCEPRWAPEDLPALPGVKVTREEPAPSIAQTPFTEGLAVAIFTRDASLKEAALQAALTGGAYYIGLAGKYKAAAHGAAAITNQVLCSSLGQSLGGHTPGERAVAILMEIIRARSGATRV